MSGITWYRNRFPRNCHLQFGYGSVFRIALLGIETGFQETAIFSLAMVQFSKLYGLWVAQVLAFVTVADVEFAIGLLEQVLRVSVILDVSDSDDYCWHPMGKLLQMTENQRKMYETNVGDMILEIWKPKKFTHLPNFLLQQNCVTSSLMNLKVIPWNLIGLLLSHDYPKCHAIFTQ